DLAAQGFQGAAEVLAQQVDHREGAGQHDADVAGGFQGAGLVLSIGDDRVEAPAAQHDGEHASEVFDDGEHQHELDQRVHAATEADEALDHQVRQEAQAGRQRHHEDDDRQQVGEDSAEAHRQLVGGLAVGGDHFAHHRIAEHQHDAGNQHADRNAEDAGHDTQRHVFVVTLVEHGQAHGNREDDSRAAHETGDQRHDQGLLAGGQGGGEVVATHVRGDDHRDRKSVV